MALDFFIRGLSPKKMIRIFSCVAIVWIAAMSSQLAFAQPASVDSGVILTGDSPAIPAIPAVDGKPQSVLSGGAGVNGTIYATVVLPDGSIVIGGQFSSVNDVPRTNLAKIKSDGTLDTTVFGKPTDGVNGTVYSLGVDAKGGILVGGYFSMAQEVERMNLVRYAPDGSLDQAFGGTLQPGGPNGQVYAIAVLADGRIVIAGEFTQVGIERRQNLARLNADGTPEGSLTASNGVDGTVRSLAKTPDGGVVVGGVFEVSGSNQRNITTVK